jgi:hypothetical protein
LETEPTTEQCRVFLHFCRKQKCEAVFFLELKCIPLKRENICQGIDAFQQPQLQQKLIFIGY